MKRLNLHYTDPVGLVILHTVSLDGFDHELQVVGQPDSASYEWVIRRGLDVEHSDCGYGISAIALRDGLIAYYGLPS